MADFGITEALSALGSTIGSTTLAEGATTATALGEWSAAPLTVASAASGVGSTLASAGPYLGAAGTLLSAKSQLDNADYQAKLAKTQATIDKQNADQAAAAGERQQETQLRNTELAESRAQALAAGSGTEATSPDVLTTEGRIAQQGQYNALTSLYNGQSKASADNYQSQIDLFKGNEISAAAPLNAFGTVLSGASSFFDKRARLRYLTSNPNAAPYMLGS